MIAASVTLSTSLPYVPPRQTERFVCNARLLRACGYDNARASGDAMARWSQCDVIWPRRTNVVHGRIATH